MLHSIIEYSNDITENGHTLTQVSAITKELVIKYTQFENDIHICSAHSATLMSML